MEIGPLGQVFGFGGYGVESAARVVGGVHQRVGETRGLELLTHGGDVGVVLVE